MRVVLVMSAALLALAAAEPRLAATDAASSDGSYGDGGAALSTQPRGAAASDAAAAARSFDAPPMPANVVSKAALGNAGTEGMRTAALSGSGASCSASMLNAGGWRNRVTVQNTAGGSRSFLLVLPQGFAAGPPLPLLLALHGGAAYATNFLDFSYLDSRGIEAGFAVAAPDGLPGTLGVGGVWRLQNAAGDGSGDVHPDVDDVAFIADLTRCIAALGVPLSDRLALAGFSLGAKFATLVACSPPPGFTSVAVVVAAGAQEPRPATCRAPLLMFQGGADPQVPFCTRALNLGPMAYWPSRLHFEAWLLSNGADDAQQSQQCSLQGDSVLYSYPPRAGGAPTTLFWSPAGSHVWPGALAGCPAADGTDLALAFLADPAKPLRCDGLAPCARDPPCGAAPWTGASMR